MICCFPCSTSHLPAVAQAMDTKEIQSSSIVDCRENEKLYPDPCRSIVETIDAANNVLLQEDEPEPQIPIMTDDEMDCLLNEISELLAKQSGSSGTPDTSDGDSNKSVEEMLMEAEKLVTLSLEHLNKSTVSISRIVPWQNVQGSDTVKKPTKTNHNSVKFSDVTETIPFQDCNLSPFKLRSKSDPDIAKTKLTDKKEIARRPNTSPSTSNVSGFKRIGGDQKDKDDIGKRTEKVYDLKLSDLAPVYEDKALEKKENELLLVHEHKFIPLDISPGDVGKEILNDGGQLNKTKLDTQNDNGVSAKKVDFLNNKVQANSDEFTGVIEDNNLNLKEQNQLMLFEEEVNSQLELIASYQRENERLCADIIKAKGL